ncbi:MAG: TrkA family potassium uptake protein [Acidimicrobiales bacterium]|nr:TrkA family potassium uptake protein [Acidimicrobiales bacterium]
MSLRPSPWMRVRLGLSSVGAVVALSTAGYTLLGLSLLDALYQTVITVFSVGFREVVDVPTSAFKAFTIGVVLFGTATVLLTLTSMIDVVIEGRLSEEMRRRRMQQRVDRLHGHIVVCGLGRVGADLVAELRKQNQTVVAVDLAPEPLGLVGLETVLGDATHDAVLIQAGIERAATLVVAMDTDAANLYVTLSARALNKQLFIVARANEANAEPKLFHAGADRVVNPHHISSTRMAALVTQPHVADFLDVVMHDRELEVRLAEIVLDERSPFVGRTLGECKVRERSGCTVVAIRRGDGSFDTNPDLRAPLHGDDVVIALGTGEHLESLRQLALG